MCRSIDPRVFVNRPTGLRRQEYAVHILQQVTYSLNSCTAKAGHQRLFQYRRAASGGMFASGEDADVSEAVNGWIPQEQLQLREDGMYGAVARSSGLVPANAQANTFRRARGCLRRGLKP